jgi:RimJ/RimL family protein N-acetyltransferase
MSAEVSLRDVVDDDLPILFEHQRDPEAARMAAFPSRDHDAFLAHWAKCRADATAVLKAIVRRDAVLGSIVSWEQEGERKVGYWIGREHWGHGIATAALAQLLAIVTSRPLHAYVAASNVGSIRVLEKCGFTVAAEGLFPGLDGQLEPELHMKLD